MEVTNEESVDARNVATAATFSASQPAAQAFSADLDDARALGKFFWDNVYPASRGHLIGVGTAGPNSPFDLSPGDNVWPERSSPLGLPGPSVWGAYE